MKKSPLASESIRRAQDAAASAIQDVRIDHRGAHVGVAKQVLHGADVVTVPQQFRREGVSKSVRSGRLREPGPAGRLRHGLLDDGLVEVVAMANSGVAIRVVGGGREYVLPSPLTVGARVL